MKHWKVRTKRIAAAAVCLACVLAGILLAQLPLPGPAAGRLSRMEKEIETALNVSTTQVAQYLYLFFDLGASPDTETELDRRLDFAQMYLSGLVSESGMLSVIGGTWTNYLLAATEEEREDLELYAEFLNYLAWLIAQTQAVMETDQPLEESVPYQRLLEVTVMMNDGPTTTWDVTVARLRAPEWQETVERVRSWFS